MINVEGIWKYDDAQRQISTLAKLNSRMISDIGKLTKENIKLREQAEGARTENKRLTRENDVLDMDYKAAKEHAPRQIRRLQRWCNNRIIYGACKRFEDYEG